MSCSASEREKDFVEPLDVERPDCPWPEKNAWHQAGAEEVATLMRAGGHPDIRAYECWGCGYWHVGKNAAAFAKRVRTTLAKADNRHRAERRRRNRRGRR
jgi:hypothetical protein